MNNEWCWCYLANALASNPRVDSTRTGFKIPCCAPPPVCLTRCHHMWPNLPRLHSALTFVTVQTKYSFLCSTSTAGIFSSIHCSCLHNYSIEVTKINVNFVFCLSWKRLPGRNVWTQVWQHYPSSVLWDCHCWRWYKGAEWILPSGTGRNTDPPCLVETSVCRSDHIRFWL